MAAIISTTIETALKFVILGAIAIAGVGCGKKFKDRKTSNKQ